MKALDRKLLRDLRLMWSQALTIALVVASGVAGFITCFSAYDALSCRATSITPMPVLPMFLPHSSARHWRWRRSCRASPARHMWKPR